MFKTFSNIGDSDASFERLEALQFKRVIASLINYKKYQLQWLHRRKQNWFHAFGENGRENSFSLQESWKQQLLERAEIRPSWDAYESAIDRNHLFILQWIPNVEPEEFQNVTITSSDTERVISTLEHVAKDWSTEGEEERNRCFTPILDALRKNFPMIESRHQCRILCPGCGLGRLPFEIAKQGFCCQGNEFSFHMLLPMNFILNRISSIDAYSIQPFVHATSNVVATSDIFRLVKIPDENPKGFSQLLNLSVMAGDFLEVYGEPEQKEVWDGVVTCYFIDTCKNIIEVIRLIFDILKPGGIWINFGPLLYHYREASSMETIEFSYEELRRIIIAIGFQLENERSIPSIYTNNTKSMLHYVYHCAFFVARKTMNYREIGKS